MRLAGKHKASRRPERLLLALALVLWASTLGIPAPQGCGGGLLEPEQGLMPLPNEEEEQLPPPPRPHSEAGEPPPPTQLLAEGVEFVAAPVSREPEVRIDIVPRTLRSPQPPMGSGFSVQELRELELHANWEGVDGRHMTRFEIRAPSGEVYETTLVPFDTGRSGPPSVWWKGGPPRAVELQRQPLPTGARATAVLPVAGSFIAQYAMRGTWQVAVSLDSEARPLAFKSFVLQ